LYADGKVVTPLFKAKRGEKFINKTTGEAAWGCKFVIVATRDLQQNSRIILDAAFVPTSGGEAAQAVDMFTRHRPHLPGAQTVIYDTALRGKHHQHLMRELGLMTVNRVTAAAGIRKTQGGKTRKRIGKSTFVESKTVSTVDGPREVKLFARGGQIGVSELTDTGELTFIPLDRSRTHRTQAKTGCYRWYNDYRLPDGVGTVTVRLHGNGDDRTRSSTAPRT